MREDVLEEFVEASRWRGDVRSAAWPDAREPVTSVRRAYRERQRAAGLCLSCPAPAAVNARGKQLAYCERHRSQARARAVASLGVNLSIDVDLDVRCTACDAEREIPGKATRVLEGDVLYAEFDEACERCGGHRVRLEVKIDDGSPEHQGPRPPPRGDR